MRFKISFWFFVFLSVETLAQKEGNIWIFGDSAGIDFNIISPTAITSSMDGRGSCSSISDSAGNLLLYSYNKTGLSDWSTFVLNSLHDTLSNGNDLNGQAGYNQITIIPKPSQINKYFIFHSGLYTKPNLYQSDADLTIPGGVIIQKNMVINSNTMADCLLLIRHANGRDWWLITKLGYQTTSFNRFYIHLVTSNGVSVPTVHDFGNAQDGFLQKIIVNNTATKIMNVNVIGLMTEYDFDRCSGIISNPNIIFPEQTSVYDRNFWEGVYSPNDSLFYASTLWANASVTDTSRIIQYNLFVPNIAGSADTIFEVKAPVLGGALRLAPDNKIYYACAYDWGFPIYPYPDSVYNQYNMNLGVINAPDSAGAACNFQPFSFFLGGKRTYVGLPNNPNYGLGRLVGSPCDTLTSILNTENDNDNFELLVFYHPSWQKLFVNAKNIEGRNCLLQIFDSNGKIVYSLKKRTQPPYFTEDVDVKSLRTGTYIVSLQTEKEKLVGKFVKN